MQDKKMTVHHVGEINAADISETDLELLARAAHDGMRAFYSNPANQAAYEKWLPEYKKHMKSK